MSKFDNTFLILLLLSYFIFPSLEVRANELVIQTKVIVDIEFRGYNGLTEKSLFVGSFPAGEHKIDIPYQGLALLIFKDGQSYPIIIGDEPFSLIISSPTEQPLFADRNENEFFYKLLSGKAPEGKKFPFPLLMIQAKKLLESSTFIRTSKELATKKTEFHDFVRTYYPILKHSDMVRRLIAQYFMMHEYVDYHRDGAPATDIKVQYQKAIFYGVGSWLEILKKSHIPEHEILNYCVSLYYDRSMVALASLIINNHRDAAYCLGTDRKTFTFPKDLLVTDANRGIEKKLADFKSKKTIAFVSDGCPISMVETVVKARRFAAQKNDSKLIVVPLQQLSDKHLAMNRMVSGGSLLFVDDEKWRKETLSKTIKLPLFIETKAE